MSASITRDFTATTFVVREDCTLLLWHNKIEAWLPPGGHIHTDELPETAALREVLEETGLEVELLGEQESWGQVQVLRTPACILLENISPGHQHIDLIYFARAKEGEPRINTQESAALRWYTAAELENPEIAPDIRVLGCRAIAAVARQTRG
ncbi:MAG: NUDIX domain-containing protein [Candidatus Latescibacteria bacterium]|nr:NUDIX domain-containing protein [Candidatus Latescibacterota bacterium]